MGINRHVFSGLFAFTTTSQHQTPSIAVIQHQRGIIGNHWGLSLRLLWTKGQLVGDSLPLVSSSTSFSFICEGTWGHIEGSFFLNKKRLSWSFYCSGNNFEKRGWIE